MTDTELLVATIARHFPDAKVTGTTIDVGFGGVTIGCRLGKVAQQMGVTAAQLVFDLDGEELRGPIELAMNGYAPSPHDAIIEGGCLWACSFGPVLRAALSDEVHDEVAWFEANAGAASYRCYIDAFDRVLHFAPSGCEEVAAARVRLGGEPWLATGVFDIGGLPLAGDRTQILSVFVGELPDRRIVEVRLDGIIVPGFDDLVADADPQPGAPQMSLLRELVAVVPD